jgi:hypothetical protein
MKYGRRSPLSSLLFRRIVRDATRQTATAEVNQQWMLLRVNWGSFIDSDVPCAIGFKVTEG